MSDHLNFASRYAFLSEARRDNEARHTGAMLARMTGQDPDEIPELDVVHDDPGKGLLILRRTVSRTETYGDRERIRLDITWLSTTHWTEPVTLVAERQTLVTERNRDIRLNWGSGGVARDTPESRLAEAMAIIWADVARLVETIECNPNVWFSAPSLAEAS